MKIYTRSGDTGQASLFNGERLYKDDDVFQALGDVDELNSALGVASSFITNPVMLEQLETVQSRLIDVGSAVATPLPSSDEAKLQRTHFAGAEHTAQLEAWIDAMDEQLPKLTKFILPSGGQAAASLHHARSVCRRAERSIVVLSRRQAVSSEVNMYINRLSDYLFTAARHAAMTQGAEEKVYQKARS
ncbi:hypothetical protein HYH02_011958 [Chlamydomonas schloesseri]|uniref:Corrinoid adenosyltransferase MMAB n=1 Tax=Chlamydomonas schloesseri TaxID=2026947 RepID=A0A835SYF8_9CHLO|nr:hypothetical protein HYH02_011958 [Chlamydomonas schloesseri]|eukprot:KAG2435458.1 hypothetical protein HYH02_011958 [Chlamydomonas schloesseri]